jgi:hypothetical protein
MGGIQKTTQPCYKTEQSMLGWLFSSKIIPLPISFATFIKKELKVSHTSFLSFKITSFSTKKNDPLDKKNYRPVSILPTISKIYEIS